MAGISGFGNNNWNNYNRNNLNINKNVNINKNANANKTGSLNFGNNINSDSFFLRGVVSNNGGNTVSAKAFNPPEDGSWWGYVDEQWRYFNEERCAGWESMPDRYLNNEQCAMTDLLQTFVVGTFRWIKSKF